MWRDGLADALLPTEPGLRAQIYARLDNASLANLRLACRSLAAESRPLLLGRKWPEIAAAKPPAVDVLELTAQVRKLDQVAQTWPQDTWKWDALAYKAVAHAAEGVAEAEGKAARRLLKKITRQQHKHPNELHFHSAAAALHYKLGNVQAGAAWDARVLRMEDRTVTPDTQARYLIPSAQRMVSLAAEHQHWAQQATALQDCMRRARTPSGSFYGLYNRVEDNEASWLQELPPGPAKMAAHGAIMDRLKKRLATARQLRKRAQTTQEPAQAAALREQAERFLHELLAKSQGHLHAVGELHAHLAEHEQPVGRILWQRLENAFADHAAEHEQIELEDFTGHSPA